MCMHRTVCGLATVSHDLCDRHSPLVMLSKAFVHLFIHFLSDVYQIFVEHLLCVMSYTKT